MCKSQCHQAICFFLINEQLLLFWDLQVKTGSNAYKILIKTYINEQIWQTSLLTISSNILISYLELTPEEISALIDMTMTFD